MKRLLLLPIILIANHARGADPTAPVVEVPVQETCQEHIIATPRMSARDWPKMALGREVNAYVVVSYELDGSGTAQNPKVTDSIPAGLFDKTTLSILKRTDFAGGVQVPSCTYVRTYGAVRRAER